MGPGWPEGAPDLGVSPCQVCARAMGAALGTGARLALLPGRACSAVRHWEPPAPARGCHSKAGPARPVPLKKRGYDVTRNPHLNKVKVRKGRTAQATILWPAGWAPRPLGQGRILPEALPAALHFCLGEAWCNSVWLFYHTFSAWKVVISNAGSLISFVRTNVDWVKVLMASLA